MEHNKKHVVLEGHNGAGKTTLAVLVAKKINAVYVKPFSDSLGDLILWCHRKKKFDLAHKVALAAIEKIIDENDKESILIFDRHWLSLFTELPEEYYEQWKPLPFTILCWADPETTRKRLAERGKREPLKGYHEYRCQLYKEMAIKYGLNIVSTSRSDIKTCVKKICSLIEKEGILE